MVNFYIYAKDFSSSTSQRPYYHTNGLETYKQFKRDVQDIEEKLLAAGEPKTESKIIYLHWGDDCYEVDENALIDNYMYMRGCMGTDATSIIKWLKLNYGISDKNNNIKLLYIITDGLIDEDDAKRCFTMNEDMYYERVVFHAFNENLRVIDLSVAASFFKSHCQVYRNYILSDSIDISQDFDYDKINIDNFVKEKENVTSYIRLKFLKDYKHDVVALNEIDKLKKLRNRLFAELSSKPQEKKVYDLNTKDRNMFLQAFKNTKWYRTLTSSDQDIKTNIEKTFSTLINYIVSEQKSFAFDALRFDVNYNKPIEEEAVDVDVNFKTEQEIVFPDIIMDDEKGIPVIILMEFNLLDKIIFHNTKESAEVSAASFSKFKSAMDCPLFLMKDTDIGESIGYFYTLNVYKQLLESGHKTEPRTRRPFRGGLVLTDTDQFDKYNDYVLLATYFDSKKVKYNIGLFYYVLWKNCEKKQWMDKNVVERFKTYTLRRITDTVCRVGLTSLPLDPSENTSLPTALWYCVELSSRLFKDDAKNFFQERLRMFHGVAHYMIEILQYFNYDLDIELINRRTDIIKHVMILKKIPRNEEKIYYLLEKIFKNDNGFLVSEIENPCNIQKLNYLKFYHKFLLIDDVMEEKVNLNDYVHFQHHVEDFKDGQSKVKICEKTFRPYFTIDENKSFYTEVAKNTKKVVLCDGEDKNKVKITYEPIDSVHFDRMLSHYNLFINFVKQFEKYPTLPEYISYILNKKRYHEDLVTIFSPLDYTTSELVYSHYQSIVSRVDVKRFIEVTKQYVNRVERIKAEGIFKFNDDKDIKTFISSEEAKVNLKTL